MFRQKLFSIFRCVVLNWILFLPFLLAAQSGNSDESSAVTVIFNISDLPDLRPSSRLGIRGAVSPLSWDTSLFISVEEGKTSAQQEISFMDGESTIEYKYVIEDQDGSIVWEETDNRVVFADLGQKTKSKVRWNEVQILDISNLQKISSEDLMVDFALVETMVMDVHPGTYRYRTKEEVKVELDYLRKAFSQSLSYEEAYIAMSRLTAFLKCDHTKPGFNNQGKLMQSILHEQANKLPFTFKWHYTSKGDSKVPERAMFIEYNAAKNVELPVGTQVLSIDGVPVEEIYDKLFPLVGADGGTDKNREYKLQINGYDFRYNAFDVFYSMLFPTQKGVRQLEIIRRGDQKPTFVEVQSLTLIERDNLLIQNYPAFPKSRDDMWGFEIIEKGVALLTVNSFGLNGWKAMQLDYKAYLENVFKEIKENEIKHLILDIRENTGGNDEMKNELFKYFMPQEAFELKRVGKTRFKIFPESLKPHIRTWGDEPWFYELEPDKEEDNYFVFEENKPTIGGNPSYTDAIYLLTSPANTSLAFYTANEFRLRDRGLIIGQETGGNLRDVNGGQILFMTLPKSGIEIDFPIMGGFTIPEPKDSGVHPDLLVTPTVNDLVSSHDAALEATLQLIRSKK